MAQKLACVVERVVAHGERVYTLVLRPERPVPRFRAGQFLHLALDPLRPDRLLARVARVLDRQRAGASATASGITYAVHGRFTARMEAEPIEGRAGLDQAALRRLRGRRPTPTSCCSRAAPA